MLELKKNIFGMKKCLVEKTSGCLSKEVTLMAAYTTTSFNISCVTIKQV